MRELTDRNVRSNSIIGHMQILVLALGEESSPPGGLASKRLLSTRDEHLAEPSRRPPTRGKGNGPERIHSATVVGRVAVAEPAPSKARGVDRETPARRRRQVCGGRRPAVNGESGVPPPTPDTVTPARLAVRM